MPAVDNSRFPIEIQRPLNPHTTYRFRLISGLENTAVVQRSGVGRADGWDQLMVLILGLICQGATMPHTILANTAASVSELKKNPMATVAAGEGFPVAILNRNEPAFYCVPAKVWEEVLERLEDVELNAIADARVDQPVVKVRLDDL